MLGKPWGRTAVSEETSLEKIKASFNSSLDRLEIDHPWVTEAIPDVVLTTLSWRGFFDLPSLRLLSPRTRVACALDLINTLIEDSIPTGGGLPTLDQAGDEAGVAMEVVGKGMKFFSDLNYMGIIEAEPLAAFFVDVGNTLVNGLQEGLPVEDVFEQLSNRDFFIPFIGSSEA